MCFWMSAGARCEAQLRDSCDACQQSGTLPLEGRYTKGYSMLGSFRLSQPRISRGLIADAVLFALLIGPLAAPLLYAWGWFVPRTVSGIITTMGMYVCPQPERGLMIGSAGLMAVCMRCYGTLLGFLLTRLWYASDRGAHWAWLPRYGLRSLPIFALLIFAYPAEFAAQIAGWWPFNNGIVTVAGLVTGVGLGLMFHPMLQRAD